MLFVVIIQINLSSVMQSGKPDLSCLCFIVLFAHLEDFSFNLVKIVTVSCPSKHQDLVTV